jgi:hypothetical protein
MTKIIEWDDRVKFKEQIEEKGMDGHVVLINKFIVEPDKAEQFLKDWTEFSSSFLLIIKFLFFYYKMNIILTQSFFRTIPINILNKTIFTKKVVIDIVSLIYHISKFVS